MANTNTNTNTPTYSGLGYLTLQKCQVGCDQIYYDSFKNSSLIMKFDSTKCYQNCNDPSNSTLRRCHGFVDSNGYRDKSLCKTYCTNNTGKNDFNPEQCKFSCDLNC